MSTCLATEGVPLLANTTLPPKAALLADDWSTFTLRGYGNPVMWPVHQMSAANATYQFVSWDGGTKFYWGALMFVFFVYLAYIWYLAADSAEKPPLPHCLRRCNSSRGQVALSPDIGDGTSSRAALLRSASKVLDVCKVVSVLFIFLSAENLTSMVCETPAVLIQAPGGWMMTSTLPSWLGNARLSISHLAHLDYTVEQYHAVVAMYSASPDYRYFYILYASELIGLAVVVCTWSEVENLTWVTLYGVVSLLLAVAWGVYGTQAEMQITLLDSIGSSCGADIVYCIVPYLPLISRSFAALHMLIAGFYLGLAAGARFGCRVFLKKRNPIKLGEQTYAETTGKEEMGEVSVRVEMQSNPLV